MQGGAELTDTLQNTVLPYSVEGGPESAHQEWVDDVPFSNLLSDSGSVQYLAC